MILLSHPTGNANVRNAALALNEANLLAEFWTCVSWDSTSALNRLLPTAVIRQLARRSIPKALQMRTHRVPLREIGRMLSTQLGWSRLYAEENAPFNIDTVWRNLDQKVSRRCEQAKGVNAVYAYEDGAQSTFNAARLKGWTCIYDLPIGYWRAGHLIYEEESQRTPEWACTLTGRLDSAKKLARKDEELRLADLVLVASSYTKSTLAQAAHAPKVLHVIPYGAPECSELAPEKREGKLKVLFAGGLGQRKGLSYLLEAIELTRGGVELTLIGQKTSAECEPLNRALRKHRWIASLSHQEMLKEMGRHDVFVFPSLFEGFGLVILEAMSQGLPVITTPHTAGPDVICDGVDGFIVPIRSAEAIAEKLDQLASDRPRLETMKHAAQAAAARFTWAAYRKKLAKTVLLTIEDAGTGKGIFNEFGECNSHSDA